MATVLNLLDKCRIRIGTYCQNQAGINVLHLRVIEKNGTGATDEQLALALDTAIAPDYKACLTNTASYYGVGVQIMGGLSPVAEVISAEFVGVGTAGTNPLPLQVAGLVKFKTDLAGRQNRGRMYVCFPDEADNETVTAKPTPGYILRASALGENFDSPITVGTGGNTVVVQFGVYHRLPDTITDFNEDTQCLPRWATQRRRGAFGRPNPYPPIG